MQAWERIQTTLDYIETHPAEEIDVQLLAGKAALSPFYYQRLFGRLVGKPVKEYVRLRRLALAAAALRNTQTRILDIALEYGFGSHQSFTRAFKEAYGITPEAYRGNPTWRSDFQKPDLSMYYTLVDDGVPLVAEGIVLEVAHKTLETPEFYAGHSVESPTNLTPMGPDTGLDPLGELWTRFHAEKRAIPHALLGGNEIGVSMMGSREGYFKYFAGVQTTGENTAPSYEHWTLKAGEYVVCRFEAETFEEMVTSALDKALAYLYQVWLPKHDLATQPYSAERYPSPGRDTLVTEIWVQPIPPEATSV